MPNERVGALAFTFSIDRAIRTTRGFTSSFFILNKGRALRSWFLVLSDEGAQAKGANF